VRLSEAEWTVMNALWERHPASAREVLEAVRAETGWAYTTVRTILFRLAAKGAVKGRRGGAARVFEPLLTRRQARRSAVRALLQRAFGGSIAPFVQFLVEEKRLSKRDRAAILDALRREEGAR